MAGAILQTMKAGAPKSPSHSIHALQPHTSYADLAARSRNETRFEVLVKIE